MHISDLHIGKSVNGFSMLDEQRHAFRQIIGYIQTERPSAVVVAGDVYDRAVPGAEAVGVFDDFVTELARENVAVLLISGNHDSPERLSYASRLLMERQLFFCCVLDGNMRRVSLKDEFGDVSFWLMPFVKPLSVNGQFPGIAVETHADAVSAVIEASDIDYNGRNVLVSHQFFTTAGTAPIRSESEINPIGGLDAVDAALVERFDYVALGHLHGAQTVGAEHIRYSGSPLKYSFSEWRQKKSVTLVELGEKGRLSATALPLTPLHDMREIKGKLAKLTSDELSSLADKEDYLRVILTDEEEIVDPLGKIRAVYPNVMSLDFENSRTSVDISEIAPAAEQTARLSAYDLFNEFFLDVNGSVMSGEQAKIVKELLDSEVVE